MCKGLSHVQENLSVLVKITRISPMADGAPGLAVTSKAVPCLGGWTWERGPWAVHVLV